MATRLSRVSISRNKRNTKIDIVSILTFWRLRQLQRCVCLLFYRRLRELLPILCMTLALRALLALETGLITSVRPSVCVSVCQCIVVTCGRGMTSSQWSLSSSLGGYWRHLLDNCTAWPRTMTMRF